MAATSTRRRRTATQPGMAIRWPGQQASERFDLRDTAALRALFEQQAPWWTYALLNRARWRGTNFLALAQGQRALDLWRRLFDGRSLAAGTIPPVMEVSVRSAAEADNWGARLMPWEFFLNAVIRANHPREFSDERRVPVIRRWADPDAARAARRPVLPPDPARWRVMVVLSAPGFIGDHYGMRSEREMLLRRFCRGGMPASGEDDPPNFRTLWTPTLAGLRDAIGAFRPDIVHFAGCDTHQTMSLAESTELPDSELDIRLAQLGLLDADGNRVEPAQDGGERDGYALLHEDSPVLHGTAARIRCVPYDELPAAFAKHTPALACWNLYNSGNRVAALSVGEGGAGAAVGFQDYIDDGVAEEYFDEFYRGLADSGGEVATAHVRGLQAAWRLPGGLGGAGIVCWTGPSRMDVFQPDRASNAPPDAASRREAEDAADHFEACIRVPAGLNYAQLHQGQASAFRDFRLFLAKPYELKGLSIEVRLNGEDRELAYRGSVDLCAPFLDLRDRIQFPLTAPLARSCRESVVTTLYVRIQHGERVLHCETYVTRLLPADQWRFSEGNAHTLASFVFPRDPEIEKLVLAAQKYVRVLRDDATAGFEGYQAEDGGEVDLQVRALWSALLHEYRLGYINPPPAYSRDMDSQRLRTPTMVLRGGWGTCVDLALLLAAALELVDIYPTVFVLKAHAFAGYWRSAAAREAFLQVSNTADSWGAGQFSTRRPVNGMFLSSSLDEIRQYIDSGELMVLEATLLTNGGGFEDAIRAGVANLDDPGEFDYMIDLMSARAAQITPLPLNHL